MSRIVYRNLKGILNPDGTLPKRVEGIDCCYHDRPFDTQPIPIVEEYDAHRDIFYVRRCACSPQCAKSFISQFTGDWHRTLLMLQRRLMVERGMVEAYKPVPCARHKDALIYKGGHMMLEDWLKPLHEDDNGKPLLVVTEQPKMVPHCVMLRMSEKECDPDDKVDDNTTAPVVADNTNEEDEGIPLAAANLKNLSTHNIARPPEDQCIKTVDDLLIAYPDMDLCDPDPGPFVDWVERTKEEGKLPNGEQCQQYLSKRASEKRAKRANKKKTTTTTPK
jgi:hypothetical protein